ncbi:MAG: hydrogenase formation protein HypD [Pseudomonadota bacterium]
MKYIEEFRAPQHARRLIDAIAAEATGNAYRLMEFCGGHTHALCRHGLAAVLPANLRMIHGPGCPVCVLPIGRLDGAIAIAGMENAILCSYGDMLRVPASHGMTLLKAKAQGGDVRLVYSALQAVEIAAHNPAREVVFFAIGFETTTPPTAVAIIEARRHGLRNFFVYCNHVLTPAAIHAIMAHEGQEQAPRIDGFVGPGHVSAVIGAEAYAGIARRYRRPIAIAGFEPVDMLIAIHDLVRQVNRGTALVNNLYARAVHPHGNGKAQALMADVFALRDSFAWRGLGEIAKSALRLSPRYHAHDAELHFDLPRTQAADHKACACGDILRGAKEPADCAVFARACTPESPLGACMVSSEGACAAHYRYQRGKAMEERG